MYKKSWKTKDEHHVSFVEEFRVTDDCSIGAQTSHFS